jgi:hypothetical protein
MLRSVQYKRFTKRNELRSLPVSHWCIQAQAGIDPIGYQENNVHKRPGSV